jgi:hypothetical protein
MLKIECKQELTHGHIFGKAWLVSSVDKKVGAFYPLICGKSGGMVTIQYIDGIGANDSIYQVCPVKKSCQGFHYKAIIKSILIRILNKETLL